MGQTAIGLCTRCAPRLGLQSKKYYFSNIPNYDYSGIKTIMRQVDERKLLARLKKGDENAFVAIYDRYKDALSIKLLYLLKSDALAEEALQDLFMKVWTRRSFIDPEKSFGSYLYRIAESIAYDIFRKAQRQRHVFEKLALANSGSYTHVEESIIEDENRGMLETILQHLPTKRRRIFVACKLEGKSYKEAAEEFGVSTSTVSDHIQKATQHLKNYVHSLDGLQFAILFACVLGNK